LSGVVTCLKDFYRTGRVGSKERLAAPMNYRAASREEADPKEIENWLTGSDQKGHRSALYSAKLGNT